jgi:hypothetical protein
MVWMTNRPTHLSFGFTLASLAAAAAPSGCSGSTAGYGVFANIDGGGVPGATNQGNVNQGSSSGYSSSSGGGGSNGSSSNGGGDDSSDTCTTSCNSDSDCQNSCAPPQNGGVECCDQSSHTCFANQSGVCSDATDSGVE